LNEAGRDSFDFRIYTDVAGIMKRS